MSNDNSKKNRPFKQNVVESFREIGTDTAGQVKKDLLSPMPRTIAEQLFGMNKPRHAEIIPGESLEMSELWNGKREEIEGQRKKLAFEKTLLTEEKELVARRKEELSLELHVIRQEMVKITQSLPELDNQVKVAALNAGDSKRASVYDKFFVQNIISFLRGFVKKIENANVWMSVANKRASKKNVWGQNYKKHGAKYLLSGEHYSQRGAG